MFEFVELVYELIKIAFRFLVFFVPPVFSFVNCICIYESVSEVEIYGASFSEVQEAIYTPTSVAHFPLSFTLGIKIKK